MIMNDSYVAKEFVKHISDAGSYFETIDDAANILPRFASLIRINSESGDFNDNRINARVRLIDGTEVTAEFWMFGNSDGTGIVVR